MKIKKKEDQSVDTSYLLRRGNKLPMEGVTETKLGAEMDHPETAPPGDPSHIQPPNLPLYFNVSSSFLPQIIS
jgi:hypothetical protein